MTLPFGVDNVILGVNDQDPGSLIAYSLTSNIYLEGLSKVNYLDLEQIITKQQETYIKQ